MTVIFTRQPPEVTAELRREFRHGDFTKRFLTKLFVTGALNPILHKIYLPRVLKGKPPKGFDIHHIRPLSGGGNNSLSNLCLIEKPLHRFLNKHCFDPALKDIKVGETVEIDVPDLPPLALYCDFSSFIQKITEQKKKEEPPQKPSRILHMPLKRLPSFQKYRK